MPQYQARCHCGAVHVEIKKTKPIDKMIDCNCSICQKKGVLNVAVEISEFRLVQGDDVINDYQFGSGDAHHKFCAQCGIHVFGRPRNNPGRYIVNARCLDDFDAVLETAFIIKFDGQNHPKDRDT